MGKNITRKQEIKIKNWAESKGFKYGGIIEVDFNEDHIYQVKVEVSTADGSIYIRKDTDLIENRSFWLVYVSFSDKSTDGVGSLEETFVELNKLLREPIPKQEKIEEEFTKEGSYKGRNIYVRKGVWNKNIYDVSLSSKGDPHHYAVLAGRSRQEVLEKVKKKMDEGNIVIV